MAPGSQSATTYHDPWADPDAYLSLISRMHGNDVASGIKEIMDAIMANEDTMKSYISQVPSPPLHPLLSDTPCRHCSDAATFLFQPLPAGDTSSPRDPALHSNFQPCVLQEPTDCV